MKARNAKRLVLALVILTVGCVAIAYGIVRAYTGVFKMPGAAMEPTIRSGESFRADMAAYESVDPQRWELVVFRPPQHEERRWVFRVVGLPGETISFGEAGLLIDGKAAEPPLGISYAALDDPDAVAHPLVVPPENYYVLGDNPKSANDSRMWGVVPRDHILGQVEDR